MQKLSKLFCLGLLLSVAQPAFAAEVESTQETWNPRWELSALSNGAFFFNDDGSLLLVASGIAYQLIPGLQLALDAAFVHVHASRSDVWGLGFAAGPVVNFPWTDLRSAFFLSAKYGTGIVGGTNITSNSNNSRGLLDFSIGKRFKVFEQLSYTPSIGFSQIVGGPSGSSNTNAFRVVLLGFSIFF